MKDAVVRKVKSIVINIVRTNLFVFLIPIIVFFIAIALAIGASSSSSSTSSSSASGNTAVVNQDGNEFSDSDSISFAKELIRKFEDAKISDDGKYYIVTWDGTGPVVGYGVDIATHGEELKNMGYGIELDDKIPIEVVDAIEERERNSDIREIKTITSGLNLKEYQIIALVSRAYNCGTGSLTSSGKDAGAVGIRNGKNFVEAYKAYYDENRDGKYGKKDETDFNHSLYTTYLNKPTTSKDKELPGLVTRRKSEWILFQTGYSNDLQKYYVEEKNNNSNEAINTKLTGTNKEKMEKMIARAIEIANDADGKKYTYNYGSNGPTKFDCSSFCKYLYKQFFNIDLPRGTNSYETEVKNSCIGTIKDVELQPGDILWRDGHVEMYIGNGKRVGAHYHYDNHSQDDITVENNIGNFTHVYRFVK